MVRTSEASNQGQCRSISSCVFSQAREAVARTVAVASTSNVRAVFPQ